MKIYFAASIRGGQKDKEIYKHIIAELQKYGKVLTEHIVAETTNHLGSAGDSRDIYSEDVKRLHEADVLIAEVSQPSFGVGYEIAHAERVGKTVLCLYRPQSDKSLSAMIAGSPFCNIKEYKSLEELDELLAEYFAVFV